MNTINILVMGVVFSFSSLTTTQTSAKAESSAANKGDNENNEGLFLKDAPLNEVFNLLALKADREYVQTPELTKLDYHLTGHLNEGDPLQHIKDIAFLYGLNITDDGKKLFATPKANINDIDSPSPEIETTAPPEKGLIEIGDKFDNAEDGLKVVDASLNDLLQLIALKADLQYFHNPQLSAEHYRVNGRIKEDENLKIIKELAAHYDLQVHMAENTVYVLTKAQSDQLLSKK